MSRMLAHPQAVNIRQTFVQRLPILVKQNSVIKQSISERVLPKKLFYENRQTSSKSHKVAKNLFDICTRKPILDDFKTRKFSHFRVPSRSNAIKCDHRYTVLLHTSLSLIFRSFSMHQVWNCVFLLIRKRRNCIKYVLRGYP